MVSLSERVELKPAQVELRPEQVELRPEHVEAIVNALDVLVRMNELGILDAVKDLLDVEVIGRVSSLLMTPGTLRLLDYIDDLLNLLGSIDYEALKEARPVGLLGLLKALTDPDVQRGLGIAVEILRSLGKQAKK